MEEIGRKAKLILLVIDQYVRVWDKCVWVKEMGEGGEKIQEKYIYKC